MYFIFGLGNPGPDYKWTRHNTGFEVINKLAYDFNIPMDKKKFRARLGEGQIEGHRQTLIKPQTYMNLSGECVRDIINFYKKGSKDIIIIYDDVDIPIGDIRIRESGSAGTHNGMKNIIYQLGTEDFLRIRVGIGPKPSGYDMAEYVLHRFPQGDMNSIVDGITRAGDAIRAIIKNDAATAMNIYNKSQTS